MKLNLPNLLIFFRILLIPVFLYFILHTGPDESLFRWIALIVFLVASFTDFLDGLLARRWNTVSSFGKLMDPLADKMLVSAALVALAFRQELAAWVVVIIICREFWVTALRQLALEQGKEVIAASLWGKIKTILQVVMLTALMAGMGMEEIFPFSNTITTVLVYLAVLATVLSAVEYTRSYKDVFRA